MNTLESAASIFTSLGDTEAVGDAQVEVQVFLAFLNLFQALGIAWIASRGRRRRRDDRD